MGELKLYSNAPFGTTPEIQKLCHASYAVKMAKTKYGDIYIKNNLFNIAHNYYIDKYLNIFIHIVIRLQLKNLKNIIIFIT